MNRFFLLLCFLATACSPADTPVAGEGPAAASSAAMKDAAPTIVMLGDSLTAGYGLEEDEALPAVVERKLAARGLVVRMVNAGVSGDTTGDALARYDWSVGAVKADLLVVALGANDFLMGMPAETPRKNLVAILDRAKAAGLPVALVGVAIPTMGRDPHEAGYGQLYPDLAKAYGAPLLPNLLAPVSARAGLLMADGLHPTAAGVEAMGQTVADFLAPVVAALD